MPKKKRMPKVSQIVKQNQTVKINIQNLLPKLREPPRGDYIAPKRGMPMGNLNQGSQTRLVGPSIQYAVRPPEFLPLPERFNSQGQPSYVREAPARVGRPDLIGVETNPSDIAPARVPIRAIPSTAVPSPQQVRRASSASVFGGLPPVLGDMNPFAPVESVQPIQMIPVIDSPSMDESQRLVAEQVETGEKRGRGRPKLQPGERGKPKERKQYGPFIPHPFQQGREQASLLSPASSSASAAITGTPPTPSSGFITTKKPRSRLITDEDEDESPFLNLQP